MPVRNTARLQQVRRKLSAIRRLELDISARFHRLSNWVQAHWYFERYGGIGSPALNSMIEDFFVVFEESGFVASDEIRLPLDEEYLPIRDDLDRELRSANPELERLHHESRADITTAVELIMQSGTVTPAGLTLRSGTSKVHRASIYEKLFSACTHLLNKAGVYLGVVQRTYAVVLDELNQITGTKGSVGRPLTPTGKLRRRRVSELLDKYGIDLTHDSILETLKLDEADHGKLTKQNVKGDIEAWKKRKLQPTAATVSNSNEILKRTLEDVEVFLRQLEEKERVFRSRCFEVWCFEELMLMESGEQGMKMLLPCLERLRDHQSNTCMPYLFGVEFNKEYPSVHDEMVKKCRSVGEVLDQFIEVADEPDTDARSVALGRLDLEFIDELCLPFKIAQVTASQIQKNIERTLGKPPRRDREYVQRRRRRVNEMLAEQPNRLPLKIHDEMQKENADGTYGRLTYNCVANDIERWRKGRNKSPLV